jgi:hypothetical protein
MLAQKRNRFARFGWIALLGTLAQPLAAQQAGELRGLVKDQDNAPVTAVTVVVERSRSAAQTGQDGRFVLRGLPAGTYSSAPLGSAISLPPFRSRCQPVALRM